MKKVSKEMNSLKVLSRESCRSLVSLREGETKFYETVHFINNKESLEKELAASSAQFVLFGIKEDLGVIGNLGKKGSRNTWEYALKALLNTQNNRFNDGSKVLVLGCLEFNEILNDFDTQKTLTLNTCRKSVELIDKEVVQVVHNIVKAGKIPLIIGGGHNNAYGNIKGTSLALGEKINAINFDAHSDFRALEGRHSGNGFSYSFEEGYLDRYFIFGLHENYNSENVLTKIDSSSRVKYETYEAIEVQCTVTFDSALSNAIDFIGQSKFGIEIDCDTIEGIQSSAMTPSSFSVATTRRYISKLAEEKNACYLHLCEAIVTENGAESNAQIGKLLAYLITDFIKAKKRTCLNK